MNKKNLENVDQLPELSDVMLRKLKALTVVSLSLIDKVYCSKYLYQRDLLLYIVENTLLDTIGRVRYEKYSRAGGLKVKLYLHFL